VGGRYKAFYTCGSHLSAVSLFYGTAFGVYMSSVIMDSLTNSVVTSMMHIVIPQMMNLFSYSLRNRERKEALRHFIIRISSLLLCHPLWK
jgi:olfactory receptor